LSGTSAQSPRASTSGGASGFHTGIGVAALDWARQRRRPATALPCVPSTWNSTSSSRNTRTHHDELNWATTPSSSSKIAYAASSAVAAYSSPFSSQRRGMCVRIVACTARTGPNRFSST
jgi:hypothetical protein